VSRVGFIRSDLILAVLKAVGRRGDSGGEELHGVVIVAYLE